MNTLSKVSGNLFIMIILDSPCIRTVIIIMNFNMALFILYQFSALCVCHDISTRVVRLESDTDRGMIMNLKVIKVLMY